jgi:hypothetical protein
VIRSVAEACRSEGVTPVGVMGSPLLGPAGNVEFLLYARMGAIVETDFDARAEQAITEGMELAGTRGPLA